MTRCFRCFHTAPAYEQVEGVPLCRSHARQAKREKQFYELLVRQQEQRNDEAVVRMVRV